MWPMFSEISAPMNARIAREWKATMRKYIGHGSLHWENSWCRYRYRSIDPSHFYTGQSVYIGKTTVGANGVRSVITFRCWTCHSRIWFFESGCRRIIVVPVFGYYVITRENVLPPFESYVWFLFQENYGSSSCPILLTLIGFRLLDDRHGNFSPTFEDWILTIWLLTSWIRIG